MSIKSTDLKKDVLLKRGNEILLVKEVKKEGRKTIAVCMNQTKNKKEELSVSDLYYAGTKVIDTTAAKPLPAAAKQEKPKETKGKKTITYQRRGQGILTTVRDADKKTLWSSWVRRPLEVKKKAA